MEFWVFQIVKFWKFTIFRNKTISWIWWFLKLWNLVYLWNFPNWKFLKFSNIANFLSFPNWEFLKWLKLENWQISKFFLIRKTTVWLKKFAILELFVYLIFRTTRNFANFLNFYFLFSFGRFTFERSLIFKFEPSAILKCSKF